MGDNIQSTALTDVCPSTRKNHFSFKVAFEKLLKDGLQECWDPEYDKLSDDFQQFIIYKFIQTYWGVDGEGGDLEKAKQQLRGWLRLTIGVIMIRVRVIRLVSFEKNTWYFL